MKKIFFVSDEYINTRIDRWIKKKVIKIPQSLIEKNLRKGNIKINNKKEKSSYKLRKRDEIIFYNYNQLEKRITKSKFLYIPTKKEIIKSGLTFIENNENFVVLNKPTGISVQSGTKSKRNIIDILRKTEEFNNVMPYPVHRIDKETTGILIVAKNRKYAQLLTSLFRIRKIHKSYLGIVIGNIIEKKGTFVDILFYYEGKKKVESKAITHFSVIDSNNHYTLVKLNPQTGRKHQLRKQLLIRGNPILGDIKYRTKQIEKNNNLKLMLHAHKISFSINDIKYNFTAELPSEFKRVLKEKSLKIYQQ